MDMVTIDGVEYVKAAVLAKKHGYTTDYIGQLCRGNKVDAHLVGRTWYVYPPSLDSHKSTRYAELRFADKTINEATETTLSRRNVIAPPAKSTAKAQATNFSHRVFWRGQEYAEDSEELLPALRKEPDTVPVTKMHIALADSKRVNIVGRSEKVTMVSEPVPAIALAGTLKVQAYEPRYKEVLEEDDTQKDIEKHSYVDSKLSVTEEDSAPEPVPVSRSEREASFPVYDVPLKKQAIMHAPLSFSPRTVKRAREDRTTPPRDLKKSSSQEQSSVRAEVKAGNSLFFNLVIAPAMVLLVVMVAGSFLFLESLTQVNARGEQVKILNLSASILESF